AQNLTRAILGTEYPQFQTAANIGGRVSVFVFIAVFPFVSM
ncbi:hypothetical protein PDO_5253, partial [Rhizobium sp. PDO1-076]